MRRLHVAALVLVVALLLCPSGRCEEPVRLAPTEDAIEITQDTVLEPGTHLVATRDGRGVLRIRTDGVTLDLGGATLRGATEDASPDELDGVGILVENAKGVTVRNGLVTGFGIGVRAVNAPGLVIEDIDASGNYKQRLLSTPEAEDASDWLWPHSNDAGEWEGRWGAGFSLTGCAAQVRRCRVRHGQNGLLLTRCTECAVYDNDFAFNSGWGIALYRTSHSEVSHNNCDFCVRGYSHDVYYRGQDSAGILVFEQCSHNVFVRNSATHSGDGFFLYAGHETTQRTGKGGCNHNKVFANDFRYAVANGIEATFSDGNVFAFNKCSGADHGIWAGYSYRSQFLFNQIHDCMTAGISVEHGHDNSFIGNDVKGARYGIHLWWDEDKQFLESVYGKNQDCSSSKNEIHWNTLAGRDAALRLDGDTGSRITFNHLSDKRARLAFRGATRPERIAFNACPGVLHVTNDTGRRIEIVGSRRAEAKTLSDGPVTFAVGTPPPVTPPAPPITPTVKGRRDVDLPADMPVGREQMRIDEWGPIDPRETRLFPSSQAAPGPVAKVYLLGREAFEIAEVTEGISAEPRQGTAPATITLRAAGEGLAFRPYRLVVSTGGRHLAAAGTLVHMAWDVRFFVWDDATDPLKEPEAFQGLLASEPVARRTVDALDFAWKECGPEGVRTNAFATRATSTVELPAGTWKLGVVSDDGVRLFVDGKKVIERWERHGPTKDVTEVTLEAGVHEFRIEHFEIDGWSWLAFRLERVD